MVDCHIHMVLDGVDWREAIYRHSVCTDITWVEKTIAQYAKLGYTYLRDGGDMWGVGAYAKTVAAQHGIVYKTPLAPLSKKGHYGGFIGLQWGSLQEFAHLVYLQKKQGCDFCKIMVSGLMDFDRYGVLTEDPLPAQEMRALVHIAHEEGLAVMAHCNGAEAIYACADAGADSIEHGAYPNEECLAVMVEAETVWVPTLSTIGNLRGKGRYDENAVCRIFETMSENVVTFARMGGLVACGSDAGAWAVAHGCDSERRYLEDLGIDWETGSAVIQEKF